MLRARGGHGAAEAGGDLLLSPPPLAHLHLGTALLQAQRPEEALTHCRFVLMLQPGHADALLNQAAALQTLGRATEALATLDRLLALQPDSAEAHLNRGIVLQGLNRLEEAQASLDRALALDPESPAAHLARNQPDQALALLEAAFRAHPNHIVATNLLQLPAWTGHPAARRGPPPVLDDSILAISYLQDWGDLRELG